MTYRFQRVSKITLLCFAGLWALLFATYSGALTGEFLFDDEFLVIKNTFIHQWPSWKTIFTSSTTMGSGGIDSFYRPLQTLIYYFVYQVAGASVLEFHFLNIFIHGLNACLIYVLGIHLRFSRLASYVGALIWMLHPLHTECVAYISATADSLYVFFSLMGLITLFPNFSARRIAMASVFFVLGLLTKESAIVFPALALVALYVNPERHSGIARAALRTLPLWIIALTYLILRKTVLDFDDSFQFYATPNIYTENILFRLYTFLATIPAYLQLLVYPTEQHFDRHFMVFTDPFATQVLTGAAFLVATTLYVLIPWRNKNRALVFGFLWLACAHFPHTGIFVPVNALILEHWMYFPSAGLLLGVASTLQLWLQKLHFALNLPRLFVPALSVMGASLVLGAESYLTFQQNKVWANPIALYSNNIRYNPSGSARIYNNLAMAYDEAGRVSEAIMTYKQAIAIQDTYPQTHHNLGRSYLRQNNTDDAIKEFEAAIAIDPNFYHSYAMLAQVYEKLGDVQKSQDYYKKFLEIRKKFFP